jgi:redox-sensitive bicupin YhaK (pirin superfamily)
MMKMAPAPNLLQGRNIGQDFAPHLNWRMYHGSEVPGFPYHPHRGFETITIGKQGFVDHSDSLGAAGRFGEGDVQWMTAGKGVQHSEMFPLVHPDQPNTLEIFQVWLNLPRASKLVEPHFKMLWKDEIPHLELKDGNGNVTTVDLIAGSLAETPAPDPTPDSWASDPSHAVRVMTVKMEPEASWTLPATATGANRSVYFYQGDRLTIAGENMRSRLLAHLKADTDIVLENGKETAYLLILEGKPINEPVAQYGPFVMNTQEEIQQAFAEYRRTEFGGWPWPAREQVHPREKARFALHADGREELKGWGA